jgi:hypothetical protein
MTSWRKHVKQGDHMTTQEARASRKALLQQKTLMENLEYQESYLNPFQRIRKSFGKRLHPLRDFIS